MRCDGRTRKERPLTPGQLAERGLRCQEDYDEALRERWAACDEMVAALASAELSGEDKGYARCAYLHKHGRLPLQCGGCWLLPANCICHSLRRAKPATKIIVHVHPDEWAKGSNTGCLCALSLEGCEILMRGHRPDDERMRELLADTSVTTALLWPGPGALEPHELRELAAQRTGGRVALVAIDGTWSAACRMRGKGHYPEGMPLLKLPPDLALPPAQLQLPGAAGGGSGDAVGGAACSQPGQEQQQQQQQPPLPPPEQQQQQQQPPERQKQKQQPPRDWRRQPPPPPPQAASLFRPLRKYRGDVASNGRVSTIEAVAAALLALEGDQETYEGLLHALKLKVDMMRHQKHMAEVYGTLAASGGGRGDGEGGGEGGEGGEGAS